MINSKKLYNQTLNKSIQQDNTSPHQEKVFLLNKRKQFQSKLNLSKSKEKQNLSTSQISKLSNRSTGIDQKRFHIKLPNSFYNDSKQIYFQRSRTLSQKSMCYQVRPMTFSQRKKLQESKLELIVNRRKTDIQRDKSIQPSINNGSFTKNLQKPGRTKSSINFKNLTSSQHQFKNINRAEKQKQFSQTQRKSCKSKFTQHNQQKFNKLMNGNKLQKIQQKILNKDIKRISSQRAISKTWRSPFQNTNTFRQEFQGKNIISKLQLHLSQTNANSTQLKVLNIDRMFRKKQGKLTTIIPLPVVKFQAVTSRRNTTNLTNNIKKKDKIHQIIQEFNNLLRITKILKAKSTSKILGVKGKNFTKNPTFQELMGLKIRPKSTLYPQQSEYISSNTFFQYCEGYKNNIKDDFQLQQNFISGLKQTHKKFNLQVLTIFYTLFVNKIGLMQQKVKFFLFFFIPSGQEIIYKSQIIIMLKTLCKGRNLPSININVKVQTLSQQQKSQIFLQALIRVMFGQIQKQQPLNREMLNNILKQNQEAIDLLLKLIQND